MIKTFFLSVILLTAFVSTSYSQCDQYIQSANAVESSARNAELNTGDLRDVVQVCEFEGAVEVVKNLNYGLKYVAKLRADLEVIRTEYRKYIQIESPMPCDCKAETKLDSKLEMYISEMDMYTDMLNERLKEMLETTYNKQSLDATLKDIIKLEKVILTISALSSEVGATCG